MKTNIFTKTLLASSLVFMAGAASAAAFQLAEVSTTGLGRAYAGEAAIADNASVVATNPALMSLLKQPEISAGAIYVDPNIDLEGKFTANGADASHKNIAPNALVPNLYAVYPIDDKFAVGGGMNVNYGLSTEFQKEYNAGFLGGKTELKTVNLNLSGSYRVNENFSLGLGLNAVHADAEIERYNGLLSKGIAAQGTLTGRIPAPIAENLNKIPASTVVTHIEGKKWGFGWNAGAVYEFNQNNRIGLAYHSKVTINFKGQYSNQLPTQLTPIYAQAGITPTEGASVPGSLQLVLPAYWEISGFHKVTDKFAFHYSYKYTEWSKFKELHAYGSNNNTLMQKDEKFKNSSRIAVGASYDVNDSLTLRTGIAYDESAADSHHSISIPDTDRTWYSVGATYRIMPNLSVDAGFSHLRGSKNTFTENGVKFTSKAKANLYGLNINYRF